MSPAFISTLSKPFFLSAICMLSIKNDWIRSKLPKTGLKKGGHQLFDIFSAHESIIVKNYSDVINKTGSFSGKQTAAMPANGLNADMTSIGTNKACD